jgi:LPS O-antigen subunit length determinant protein (WzzB/FepE family)
MKKSNQMNQIELNIIDFIFLIWQEKWKIALAPLVLYISVFSYQANKKITYNTVTPIDKISTLETYKYLRYNEMLPMINDFNNLKGLTKSSLVELFVEAISPQLIKKAFKKFSLLDLKDFKDEDSYDIAVASLANSMQIVKRKISEDLPMFDLNGNYTGMKKNLEFEYQIEFSFDDLDKLIQVFKYVNVEANKIVKQNIQVLFDNYLSILEEKENYNINSITLEINNLMYDYKREAEEQVLYLKEQAAIAEALGIAKNTIEVTTYGQFNTFTGVNLDTPFYLRGYEAINKEINLIESRTNKKAFIEGLFSLEKKRRNIEQNKNQILKKILSDFRSTPIFNDSNFYAATINYSQTLYNRDYLNKLLALSILIGLIIGVTYVIIFRAIKAHELDKKK